MQLARSAVIAVAFGCSLTSPGVSATWDDLGPLCQRNPEACAMYVTGIMDALLLSNASSDGLQKYCPPEGGISNEAGISIFRKLLSEHPETAAKQTAAMVHLALAQAFPCQ
jgi:hypothetical protein